MICVEKATPGRKSLTSTFRRECGLTVRLCVTTEPSSFIKRSVTLAAALPGLSSKTHVWKPLPV